MSKLPKIQPNAEGLTIIADLLKELLPNETLFALIVVKQNDNGSVDFTPSDRLKSNGLCNYISNANRNDVARLLRKAADQIQSGLN